MGKGRLAGAPARPGHYPELNAMFYNADPAEFIKMRIESLSLMACTDEQLAPAFGADRSITTRARRRRAWRLRDVRGHGPARPGRPEALPPDGVGNDRSPRLRGTAAPVLRPRRTRRVSLARDVGIHRFSEFKKQVVAALSRVRPRANRRGIPRWRTRMRVFSSATTNLRTRSTHRSAPRRRREPGRRRLVPLQRGQTRRDRDRDRR